MNPQNFSRGESSYFNCGSQKQSNQRNCYNENERQNNDEHLDGETYQKIIIPKGSIESNQTAVINVPEHLRNGKVLICRRLPQQTYRIDEGVPRVPQHWNNVYGYLNNTRANTAGRTNGTFAYYINNFANCSLQNRHSCGTDSSNHDLIVLENLNSCYLLYYVFVDYVPNFLKTPLAQNNQPKRKHSLKSHNFNEIICDMFSKTSPSSARHVDRSDSLELLLDSIPRVTFNEISRSYLRRPCKTAPCKRILSRSRGERRSFCDKATSISSKDSITSITQSKAASGIGHDDIFQQIQHILSPYHILTTRSAVVDPRSINIIVPTGPVNESSQRRNNNTDISFSPLITSTPRKCRNTAINNSISPKKGFIHKSTYQPANMEGNLSSAVYVDPPKGWSIENNTPPALQKQNETLHSLATSLSPGAIKIETTTDTPQDGMLDYSKFAPPIITSPTSSRFTNSNCLRNASNRTFTQQTRSPNQSIAEDWANYIRHQTPQQEVFQCLLTETIESDDSLEGNVERIRSPVQYKANNLLNQSHEQEIINNLVKSCTPQRTQDSFKSLPVVNDSSVEIYDKGSNSSMNSNRATTRSTKRCIKGLTCTSCSTLPTSCVSTEKITASIEKFKEVCYVPSKETKSTTSTNTVTIEKMIRQIPSCSSNSSTPSCRGRLNLTTISVEELNKIEEQERKQLNHDLRKWQQARRQLATNLAAYCL